MMIDLTERELEVIKKVLKEKATELRERPDYYQNDEVQADYFEIDVLARKIEMGNKVEDIQIEDEWDMEI